MLNNNLFIKIKKLNYRINNELESQENNSKNFDTFNEIFDKKNIPSSIEDNEENQIYALFKNGITSIENQEEDGDPNTKNEKGKNSIIFNDELGSKENPLLIYKDYSTNKKFNLNNDNNFYHVYYQNDEQNDSRQSINFDSVANIKNSKKTKIFLIKKIHFKYKKSNYIIRSLTAINQSYIKMLNTKLKDSTDISLKNLILHKPSYEDFSEKIIIIKYQEEYLSKSMKDILLNNSKNDNSYVIELIEKSNDIELIELLNKKYEDVIRDFYKSNYFKIFISDKRNKYDEKEFKRRTKKNECKSLFEEDGLIKLLHENKFIGKKTERCCKNKEELI